MGAPLGGIQVKVMVLGTYHFANPGADIANVDVEDVLLPGPQAEIGAIVEALAKDPKGTAAANSPLTTAAEVVMKEVATPHF